MREGNSTGAGIPRWVEVALCVTALIWSGAANGIAERASAGLAVRFRVEQLEGLLQSLFLLFLAVVGLRLLDWIATRSRYADQVLALPRRAGRFREWGVGAAVGWGLCLAAVLPLLLSGNLHGRMNWRPGTLVGIVLAVGTLAAGSLAEEVLFRGYAFRRLSVAMGESTAGGLLSAVFAMWLVFPNRPPNLLVALIDSMLFGLVLTMAYLRTHALWLGWGLHFAYRAVAAVLLGLPIVGHGEFGSLADLAASGPRWLSGGAFGVDAAWWTAVVMFAGMAVLYRATREYAWKYTHREIVAAGYEVVVAPPAAHVAMERAAAPPPLVQILPTTPRGERIVGKE